MAAKVKSAASSFTYIVKKKIRRKGIHAKSKTSSSKQSKNYVKPYVGQGY